VEEERLKAILESLLFAAGEPVTLAQLASVLDSVPRDDIRRALAQMATAYAGGGRGLVLEEVAGGYQLRTPKEHALYVRKLLAAKPPRLSRPLLETVAIIAYRQPITRPEIEQLRGVDTGGVLETLLERRLVRIAGRKDAPGRPLMYATTSEFLEVFGLKDLQSLPDMEEFRALQGTHDDSGTAAGADSTPVSADEAEISEAAAARHGEEPADEESGTLPLREVTTACSATSADSEPSREPSDDREESKEPEEPR
jgi:segregation and condensation protein B